MWTDGSEGKIGKGKQAKEAQREDESRLLALKKRGREKEEMSKGKAL